MNPIERRQWYHLLRIAENTKHRVESNRSDVNLPVADLRVLFNVIAEHNPGVLDYEADFDSILVELEIIRSYAIVEERDFCDSEIDSIAASMKLLSRFVFTHSGLEVEKLNDSEGQE